MVKRQLVLVAIDHVTDVERTMDSARSVATTRGADVHVVQVMPHRAVYRDERTDRWSFGRHDDRDVAIGARLASMPQSVSNTHARQTPLTQRPLRQSS